LNQKTAKNRFGSIAKPRAILERHVIAGHIIRLGKTKQWLKKKTLPISRWLILNY